jgi:signal peptide peptidase SppA
MPLTNFHSARLRDPADFKDDPWSTVDRKSESFNGRIYQVVSGQLKSNDEWEEQAYRYPIKTWPEADARKHAKAHNAILFEPAKKEKKAAARAFAFAAAMPWAILPESLEQIMEIAARENMDLETVQKHLGKTLDNDQRVSVRDAVAIIPVMGPIFPYGNLFTQISGATSIESLALAFESVMSDESIKAVVLDIDSPGGSTNGMHEFANQVFQARGTKPIISYIGNMAASGAYWIASATDRIIADPTAMLGSIGVILRLVGDSERGTVRFTSKISPRKVPSPKSAEGKKDYQRLVDDIGAVFIEAVARNRGESEENVIENYGQGALLVGAQAVEAGLADSLGNMEALISELADAGTDSTATPKGSTEMPKETDKTASAEAPKAPEITRAFLTENHGTVVEAIEKDAFAAGEESGAEKERGRIKAIEEATLPGHENLVQAAKWDGDMTAEKLGLQIIGAEKAQREGALATMTKERETAVEGAGQPPPPPAKSASTEAEAMADTTKPLEERAKAAWDADAELRAEFSENGDEKAGLETWLAYCKADEENLIRVLGKK